MSTPTTNPQPTTPIVSVIEGHPPSEDTLRLVALFDELEKGQITFLDESAKRIIELCTALLGVLTGLAAFGKDFPPPYLKNNDGFKVLAVVAVACYVLALAAALISVQPRNYRRFRNNITQLRSELERMIAFKKGWFRTATLLLFLGTAGLALLLGLAISTA